MQEKVKNDHRESYDTSSKNLEDMHINARLYETILDFLSATMMLSLFSLISLVFVTIFGDKLAILTLVSGSLFFIVYLPMLRNKKFNAFLEKKTKIFNL